MTTEKRKSEQRNLSGATPLANFLLRVLHDDAIVDNTLDVLFEHVMLGRFTTDKVTEYLRFSIHEALGTATAADWQYVTETLIADARKTLEGSSSAPARTTPRQDTDPGEMREELGHTYAQDVVSPRGARRAWTLIRNISRLVGISRAEVRSEATADAEALRAAGEYDAVRASRSSAQHRARSEERVMSAPTAITLDAGQFNLLISGLGLARLALNGCGDEYVGFATDYNRLADEIVAQLPGDRPAPRAARERLAIREGRATSTQRSS